MAYKGKVIHNPYTGEVLTFIETAQDTAGAYLKIKWKIPASKIQPAEHIHSNTDEWYEIESGTFTYSIDEKEYVATAGDKIFFPKGISHQHHNAGPGDLEVIYTCTPALDMENQLESLSYFRITGGVRHRNPSFIQNMIWLGSAKAKVYHTNKPLFLQNILSTVLAPFGRILGFRSLIP